MNTVTLRWVGDLDQDKREQAGCVSSSSDQYRPKKIELKPSQKEIRIGRINTKVPPDYPIESCINQRMISRNHATVERSAKGGPILYDHSMNGTYVNYTRVMGSVTLKHGDVICFGHLNGANLKPGEKVSVFYSDLKYRVELGDVSPSKDSTTGGSGSIAPKKRKSHIPQTTVSSTQRSDGEDDDDAEEDSDGGGDRKPPTKSARTSSTTSGGGGTRPATSKPFKTPPTLRKKMDYDDDDDDDELGDISDENEDEAADEKKSKSGGDSNVKKRSNGTEKQSRKSTHSSVTPSSHKSTAGSGGGGSTSSKLSHQSKDKRSKKSSKSALDKDGNDMFHYDTEECGARPCKQPQDIAIDWIQCDKCCSWYHQICIGLKPSDADVETYYCPYCK